MIYVIDLLSEEQLEYLNSYYESPDFNCGLATISGAIDKDWKNNQEFVGYEYPAMCNFMAQVLNNNRQFQLATAPIKYSPFTFSKYTEGMFYRKHNDNYMMEHKGNGFNVKTDFSATVFLNNPSEYEGGELELYVGNQSTKYKLDAGKCVIYPTGLLHEVRTVTSGIRKVCCFWTESRITDQEIRHLLGNFYLNAWDKYLEEVQEKIGDDFTNHVTNLLFALQRKYGNFNGR